MRRFWSVWLRPSGAVSAVVVVIPGGRDSSTAPGRPWRAPDLRMYPFTIDLWWRGRRRGVAVVQLCHAQLGWNDGARVADTARSIVEIRNRHQGAPIVLLGHSLGGRLSAALLAGDDVVGACLLAPWLPLTDSALPASGRSVIIAHGELDRVTNPAGSLAYAERARPIAARVGCLIIAGTGHSLLRRALLWHRIASGATLGLIGLEPFPAVVANALVVDPPGGSRIEA